MMRRFAILLLSLSAIQCGAVESHNNLRATNANDIIDARMKEHRAEVVSQSHQQHRELGVFTWWATLLNALCPPGPKRKSCKAKRSSGGSGGSSSSGSSGGSSSGSNGGSSSGSSGGSSSGSYNGNGGSSNGSYNGWNGDGNGGSDDMAQNMNYYSGDGTNDDDGNLYFEADDGYEYSGEGGDGWESNELGGGTKGTAGIRSTSGQNMWKFVVGAMMAGMVGAVLVVFRRRRQQEEENHPLEGSLKKRMKLFNGGVRNKRGTDMDNDGTPAFIEISSIKSSGSTTSGRTRSIDTASVKSSRSNAGSMGSYRAPQEQPAIFENESDESEL